MHEIDLEDVSYRFKSSKGVVELREPTTPEWARHQDELNGLGLDAKIVDLYEVNAKFLEKLGADRSVLEELPKSSVVKIIETIASTFKKK